MCFAVPPPPVVLEKFEVGAARARPPQVRAVALVTRPNTPVSAQLPNHEDAMSPADRALLPAPKVAYVLDATLSRLANRMIDHLEGIEDYRERLRKTLWVMLDYFDKHPKVILLLTVSIPASRYQDLPVYESPELMGAFLGMLKEGQHKGVFNNTVSSKMLLDVFMGVFGRVAQMHFLRKESHKLIDQFDDLFGILWGALKAN